MWKAVEQELPKRNEVVNIRYVNSENEIISEGKGIIKDNGNWTIQHNDTKLIQNNPLVLNATRLEWEVPVETANQEAMHNLMVLMFGTLDSIHAIIEDKGIGSKHLTFTNGIKLWRQLCNEHNDNDDCISPSTHSVCPLYGICPKQGAPAVSLKQIRTIEHILNRVQHSERQADNNG